MKNPQSINAIVMSFMFVGAATHEAHSTSIFKKLFSWTHSAKSEKTLQLFEQPCEIGSSGKSIPTFETIENCSNNSYNSEISDSTSSTSLYDSSSWGSEYQFKDSMEIKPFYAMGVNSSDRQRTRCTQYDSFELSLLTQTDVKHDLSQAKNQENIETTPFEAMNLTGSGATKLIDSLYLAKMIFTPASKRGSLRLYTDFKRVQQYWNNIQTNSINK